jgi:AcrR family transcriptional regulator
MDRHSLTPRKTPRQQRSDATVETILQGAARVLSESSLSGFNTNKIAEVAGVSIGSLYQYFPNKTALMLRLIEREQMALSEDVVRACESMQQSKSLATDIKTLVAIAIEHQFANARLALALDFEERRLPITPLIQDAQMRMVQAFENVLRSHLPAEQHYASCAKDCFLIARTLVNDESEREQPDRQALAERVQRALLGYLLCLDT